MDEGAKKSSVAAAAGKSSDNYNGSSTDKYSWSQTIHDLDVRVPVPKSVLKGKDLIVTIKSDSLEVRLKGQPDAEAEPIVVGEFTFPIDKEETCWNLFPGEAIIIFIPKSKERWWTALLKGEETIDPASIEAEIPMEELGDNEQMKIQELMWKEEQKKKGISTHDKDMEAILKKAWDAPGSPFSGMPYDPSMVKLGADNVSPEFLEAAKAASNDSGH